MCWAQHDGQWFLKTSNKFGFKVANELNQKAIKSMGKIESRHIMNALGIKKGTIKSIHELLKFLNTGFDLGTPKGIMKYTFEILSDDEFLWSIKKCLIWELVKKAGNESDYVCCCDIRMSAWFDPLGFNVNKIVIKRFPDGDNICEFKFVVTEKKED